MRTKRSSKPSARTRRGCRGTARARPSACPRIADRSLRALRPSSSRRGSSQSVAPRATGAASRGRCSAGSSLLAPVALEALVGHADHLDRGEAAWSEQPVAGGEEGWVLRVADRLEHLDRGDLREASFECAVVLEADLDAVGEAGRGDALAGELELLLGERDAGDLAPYSPAASSAKLPQPQPISSTWSPGLRRSFSQIARSFRSWACSSVSPSCQSAEE